MAKPFDQTYKSYVYKIYNKITGQFYYGSRMKNISENRHPEDDLWKYYFTSSKNIKNLIEKYGLNSFDVEIISTFDSYEDSFWEEQRLIKHTKNDEYSLNKMWVDPDTGKTVFTTWNETKEQKISRGQKISIGKKGKSNGRAGHKHKEESKIKAAQQKGWKHSDEAKEKMSKPKGPMSDERKEIYRSSTTKSWEARRNKYGKNGRA